MSACASANKTTSWGRARAARLPGPSSSDGRTPRASADRPPYRRFSAPASRPRFRASAVADALRELAGRGRPVIPDLETAIIQLYALLVFPHLVFGSYGTTIDDDATDRQITHGVDMFLGHYAPPMPPVPPEV
ncbi:TetR/AcrR family transcriptional regulator C-terminal domain-containing protein [Streptomyces sp. NPDC005775]|uniref:TetR/AcrR family transcriptional regulator C-terminal domain-containing protein n=1 Tax=unclassified Streptomyces TaxID=2593676 RepID=UPI0033E81D47